MIQKAHTPAWSRLMTLAPAGYDVLPSCTYCSVGFSHCTSDVLPLTVHRNSLPRLDSVVVRLTASSCWWATKSAFSAKRSTMGTKPVLSLHVASTGSPGLVGSVSLAPW